MGGRWKWFLRPGTVVIDLTGQAVPDGDVPGRFRRLTVEDVVPDGRATSRCDGAIVYELPDACGRREARWPAMNASQVERRGSDG